MNRLRQGMTGQSSLKCLYFVFQIRFSCPQREFIGHECCQQEAESGHRVLVRSLASCAWLRRPRSRFDRLGFVLSCAWFRSFHWSVMPAVTSTNMESILIHVCIT